MNPAKTKTVSTDIKAGNGIFRISGTTVVEKGFYKVMGILASKEEKESSGPPLVMGEKLITQKLYPEQHFTQGPPRYTDASIVKTLEEKGIGRPSTYAPTISVLLERYYVSRSNKQLVPTVLGRLICDMLVEYFSEIVNSDFTAMMEDKLDAVEEDKLNWHEMIREFYDPFKNKIEEVTLTSDNYRGHLDELTDMTCEKCGKPIVKKLGRYGYFLACSGFPECRNTKSIPLATCPRCGGDIVARKNKKRGKEFYGCTNYPECDFLTHFKPINQNCPKCGHFMVERYSKKNGSHKTCINPNCDYLHSVEEDSEVEVEGGNV
jgi:DNA topoisomerase-1